MPIASINRASAAIIAVIAVFAALKYGENIFAPMLLAFVLGVILSPVRDAWDRLGLPNAVSAFATLLAGLTIFLTIGILLEPYVSGAVEQAPVIWNELRFMLSEVKIMLQGFDELTEDVADAIGPEGGGGDAAGTAVAIPSVAQAAFYAPQYLAQIMVLIGTLYFFLLARADIYRFFGQTISRLSEEDLHFAEGQVSRYFLTVTLINASFGLIVTAVMSLLGMPSPVLWGILAFLVNFILYLGPATLAVALLLTGIVAFDGAYSFLPAALYLVLNATEGQFVTPALVGKSMSVNPLLVFLSLVVWLWLWGPLGGFIAIPVLIWVLVIVKTVLGRSDEEVAA
jgi:predicted PurR-regulated permease PerM